MAEILLVEDDQVLAYSLARILTGAGHHVTTALDGFAALKALDGETEFELLLTDLVMPPGQPHGLALARMARRKRLTLAVIFMTGYGDLGEEIVGHQILRKPVDAGVLVDNVAAILAAKRG